MERALQVIRERLEAEPVSLPVFENRPSLAVPPLIVPPSLSEPA
jgi:hypothetical protein